MDREKVFKVIILGEAGVGKSSLIRRYTQGYFSPRTTTTVGVDRITTDININDDTMKFHVLDTAGCFGFRGLIKSYMSNIDAVIFVYDITDKETFACLPLWNTILKSSGKRDITKVLVGNKRDLDTKRQVQYKNAKNYADFEGMANMEISVKEEESVDRVFQTVAKELRWKQQLENSYEKEKSQNKKSFFQNTKSKSTDFIDYDDTKESSSPKQFVRKLSLMVLGKKNKVPSTPSPIRRQYEKQHETPTTPSMVRKYDIEKIDRYNRWT